jgi:hypothetical protein
VHLAAGVASIVAGSLVGLLTVFVLWRRIPAALAILILCLSGVALGAGGLLVQEDVGAASWVFTLAVLAVMAPIHARLVFGRPGPGSASVVAGTARAT